VSSEPIRPALRGRAHDRITALTRVVVLLDSLFFTNSGLSLYEYAYASLPCFPNQVAREHNVPAWAFYNSYATRINSVALHPRLQPEIFKELKSLLPATMCFQIILQFSFPPSLAPEPEFSAWHPLKTL